MLQNHKEKQFQRRIEEIKLFPEYHDKDFICAAGNVIFYVIFYVIFFVIHSIKKRTTPLHIRDCPLFF